MPKKTAKVGQYFNYRGSRYYRVYLGGLSLPLAKEKLEARKRLAPQFKWAIRKEADGTYSVGRATRK